jgi:hypothetical protein
MGPQQTPLASNYAQNPATTSEDQNGNQVPYGTPQPRNSWGGSEDLRKQQEASRPQRFINMPGFTSSEVWNQNTRDSRAAYNYGTNRTGYSFAPGTVNNGQQPSYRSGLVAPYAAQTPQNMVFMTPFAQQS